MIIFEVLFTHIDGEKRTITIKPNDNELGFCWAKELKVNIDRGGYRSNGDLTYGHSKTVPILGDSFTFGLGVEDSETFVIPITGTDNPNRIEWPFDE